MLTTSQKTAIYKNIGRVLRDVRESLDLTVEEAAAKQNVSQKTINVYENGSPVRLGAKTVGSLIRFLGNYNALLNLDIEPFTPEPVYTFTGKELAELIREQSRQAAATGGIPEPEQ
ncbi:MAG: helix-turn-helix domain-containing protein [Proteobacteria bacterium]|nr:helix-turn-helix domain-containing protein [Pseudomonadota bacterium]